MYHTAQMNRRITRLSDARRSLRGTGFVVGELLSGTRNHSALGTDIGLVLNLGGVRLPDYQAS